MKTYFLTGSIASGKSSVLEQLEHMGSATISMDALAREVVRPGSPCLQQIAEAFGPEVLLADTHELNRSYLASVVFADADALKRLEDIELPAILSLLEDRLERLEGEGGTVQGLCVVEVPVLSQVEGLLSMADQVIYLKVPYDTRLQRALARGMSREDFMARNLMLPHGSYMEDKATVVLDGAADISAKELAQLILEL